MTRTKTTQFQYEKQTYQEDCVNNIVSLFESLRQKINFVEVMTGHHNKHKYNFPIQDTKNIDIIMETGERVIIVTGCINVLVSRVSGTLTKYNSCIA